MLQWGGVGGGGSRSYGVSHWLPGTVGSGVKGGGDALGWGVRGLGTQMDCYVSKIVLQVIGGYSYRKLIRGGWFSFSVII